MPLGEGNPACIYIYIHTYVYILYLFMRSNSLHNSSCSSNRAPRCTIGTVDAAVYVILFVSFMSLHWPLYQEHVHSPDSQIANSHISGLNALTVRAVLGRFGCVRPGGPLLHYCDFCTCPLPLLLQYYARYSKYGLGQENGADETRAVPRQCFWRCEVRDLIP